MKTICVLNQKGGVGKTSTCHHLAGAFSARNLSVLLIDNDPQASLTQGIWGPSILAELPRSETVYSAYERGGRILPESLARSWEEVPGVYAVPGHPSLSYFNEPFDWDELSFPELREFCEAGHYDVCLIDCPPNLNRLAASAISAADLTVVPLQPEDYGAQGVPPVRKAFDRMRYPFRKTDLAYLVTMLDRRLNLHKLYVEDIRILYGDQVLDTMVPRSVEMAEAIYRRLPVEKHAPKGQAAAAVRCLAAEVLDRLDQLAGERGRKAVARG